jgi:hypothetical protein
MWKEHTTSSPYRGLWIGDCAISQSMATESRDTINRPQTVLEVPGLVEVEEIMWVQHARLEGYSGWM